MSKRTVPILPSGLLAFTFGDIEDEFSAFADVADNYLLPQSIRQLKQLAGTLSQIGNAMSDMVWATMIDDPLQTEPSAEFEPVGKSTAIDLHGILEFKWHVRPLGNRIANFRNRWFALLNSSVRVELRTSTGHPVAQWDFDAGDDKSPGCHFHAKPMWTDLHAAASLNSVMPIPRLPTWLYMPTDCLEFLLGELWQNRWKNRVSESDPKIDRWKKLSYMRHFRMAQSHLSRYEDTRSLTGWMALKTWKPNAKELASS